VDSDSLARGRHLAEEVTLCGHCHGADLGGDVVADVPGVGRLWAPNLTPGPTGPRSTRDDLVRAIRFGVDAAGRTLVAMPAEHLRWLGDEDLAAVLAYLEHVPPVEREVPRRSIGPVARLSILLGRGDDILSAERAADTRLPIERPPPRAPSAEYGRYLARIGLCHLCHHADLRGGLHPLALPGEPEPPDLRPDGPLATWTRDEFARALRAGEGAGGRRLDPAWMPWPRYAGLDDLEIDALWAYLTSL